MKQTAIADRVYAAKDDSLSADDLIRDYLPFIKAETSRAIGRVVVEGRDDELSIAMIGFHEAVQSYSRVKGAFLKYASVVMRRKLMDYYRTEKRHLGQISLDTPLTDQSEASLGDQLHDPADPYEDFGARDATNQEIAILCAQLRELGVTLTDIADNCPKQTRTLESCRKALAYAKENPELIDDLKRTGKLPISRLSEGSGVERKTLERHRKYIVTLLLIYSNGYEIIRGHLKQVLMPQREGVSA